MIRSLSRAAVAALTTLAIAAGTAAADEPASVIEPDAEPQLVSGGPGNQTDPHVSGSVVSYTASDSAFGEIRHQDLTDPSTDVAVPNDGQRDSLSDVSGSMVVFRRVFTDGSTIARPIMFFDRDQPTLGTRELAPEPGARRQSATIGGDTVAFMQQSGPSSSQSDVCVASLSNYLDPAVCLTADGLLNRDPAVSPDGNTVAWTKCLNTGIGCDIYVVTRDGAGGWSAPLQLTTGPAEEILPDTNGAIVTYASNAGGDFDIWFENVDGTDERQLVLSDATGSTESNPNVSGDLIAFERELPGSTKADIYVYQLSTRTLFHLRDTADIDETLNDISVVGDQAWVVWASPDGLALGNNDVWAATFTIVSEPAYVTCLLYDPTKAHRAGRTVPLKVQLCDEAGANLSSPELPLTAVGLVKRDASASTTLAESPGNANPDSAFRYDEELAGYIFNLSTRGLTSGTWELRFTVAGDETVYALPFDVR